MPNLYLLMTILFMALATLTALDNSLATISLIPAHAGIRWLRVHFITLGTLTEAAFWLMPALVAARQNQSPPKPRWSTWMILNSGIITLLVGIPLVNSTLILTGGTFIFVAVILLIKQLAEMGAKPAEGSSGHGRPFYLAGLAYFLLGIIVGTGLWMGWGAWLGIQVPIEVHIHANSWGFLSFFFAGLIVDAYPQATGKSFAWPRSISAIYWLLVFGALGLVLGPWVGSNWFSVPGLLLHTTATIWLLLNVIKPIIGERWGVGMWHLTTSYLWFFAPVLVAPLIIAQVPGFNGAGVEQNAPQALIYGWALQFGYAILPYFFTRVFLSDKQPHLGGSWFSLVATHIGGVLFWIGIFATDYRAVLQSLAYALWLLSLLPILVDLWNIVRQGLEDEEEDEGGALELLGGDPVSAD